MGVRGERNRAAAVRTRVMRLVLGIDGSGARVAFLVDFEELFEVDVRVFLGRGQARMAQELLDDAQVRAPAEEVGGE